jgi:hypothetical protein
VLINLPLHWYSARWLPPRYALGDRRGSGAAPYFFGFVDLLGALFFVLVVVLSVSFEGLIFLGVLSGLT